MDYLNNFYGGLWILFGIIIIAIATIVHVCATARKKVFLQELTKKVIKIIPDENSDGISIEQICEKIPDCSEFNVKEVLNSLFKSLKIEKCFFGDSEKYRFCKTVNCENCKL